MTRRSLFAMLAVPFVVPFAKVERTLRCDFVKRQYRRGYTLTLSTGEKYWMPL